MKYFISLCLFLSLLFTVSAQNVRASVESSEVYLGQPFEFRIIIEGTISSEVPELADIEGIKVQYKGASTSMVSSFGTGSNSSSKTVTYSWTFTPLRKGTLLIPSYSIDVDGKIFKTASGTITVKDPEIIEGYFLFLETDKKEFWMGEPIVLTIKWLFSSSVSNPVFNLPFIESGLFSVESQTPQPGNDVYKLNIDGLEVLAKQSAQIFKGDQYSSLSFGLKLMPRESGKLTIGPVTLAFDSAERSNGFRTSYKSLVIPSNAINLKVEDLPAEALATGFPLLLANGPLTIEAGAGPPKVHIGDPLTYKITIHGALTPESVALPSLNSFEKLIEDFSIPDRRSPGKVDGESVQFTQTIRVRNLSVERIPELELPYFNTLSGSLEIAKIPSVLIEVLETEIVTSADLESTGYITSESDAVSELVSNEKGLLFNFDSELLLKKKINRKTVLLVLIFFPLLVYLSLISYKNRKYILKIRKFFTVENRNFSDIYKSLIKRNTTDIETVSKEIKKYLNEYCHMDENYSSPESIYQRLMELSVEYEISHAVKELLLSFEESEYSREKRSLDGMTVLNNFYTLSRELT